MHHDPAFAVLLPFLQGCKEPTLWVADEAALGFVKTVSPSPQLTIVSNRFDVVMAAKAVGHTALFSDFDFQELKKNTCMRIVYRFSKEKAVVHHVINEAFDFLVQDGQFILAGLKSDGTKTYLEKCRQLSGNGSTRKQGSVYWSVFQKNGDIVEGSKLDDRDYTQLRLIQAEAPGFFSKPGIFGWDRVDEGSTLLISELERFLLQQEQQPQSMLDLGCGYGYLTVMTRNLPLVRRVATDNCAAALLVMRANAVHYTIAVDVVASDAGSTLQEAFDLVLCNPPFHRGFTVAGDLTEHFLRQTARLLNTHGVAVFVVNAFIPLEQKASGIFSSVELLVNNRSYKVVALRK